MNIDIWNSICDEVIERMKEHVEPCLSPIWKFKNQNDEMPHGTGAYIQNDNRRFLITNEHVAKYNSTKHLTHSFYCSEKILVLDNIFLCEKSPIDVAISEIENTTWNNEAHCGQTISLSRFAEKHETVNGELLFFAGFSGQRSQTVFGEMISRGTPFLTQECPLNESVVEANSEYHFSIPYPPELARTLDTSVPLPYPHGFSGSLLWNTRRVECLEKKIEWDPSMAKVSGIIWGWPSAQACIIATKVEHIHLTNMIESYNQHKGII